MRPSRWQVVTLVVALCFLSGVVGWWIGRPSDPTFNDVDVGFLSDMQAHHGGAISLAFAYLGREHDPLIGQMAREIVLEQSQEISVMNAYLGPGGPVDGDDRRRGDGLDGPRGPDHPDAGHADRRGDGRAPRRARARRPTRCSAGS